MALFCELIWEFLASMVYLSPGLSDVAVTSVKLLGGRAGMTWGVWWWWPSGHWGWGGVYTWVLASVGCGSENG